MAVSGGLENTGSVCARGHSALARPCSGTHLHGGHPAIRLAQCDRPQLDDNSRLRRRMPFHMAHVRNRQTRRHGHDRNSIRRNRHVSLDFIRYGGLRHGQGGALPAAVPAQLRICNNSHSVPYIAHSGAVPVLLSGDFGSGIHERMSGRSNRRGGNHTTVQIHGA